MTRLPLSLLLALLAAACGGSSSTPDRAEGAAADAGSTSAEADFEACALLTAEEIQAATGWAPDTAIGATHGTTKTCAYHGADAMKQSLVLIVARPAPKVSSSAELAERRTRDAARSPELQMRYTPLEGLDMPAVRSESEGSDPTLEAVTRGRVLGVTTASFDAAKALAPKAAARLP